MDHSIIGIDISKDTLDCHHLTSGEARQFANTGAGHKALIAWIGDPTSVRVVFEPTGAYHKAMEAALGKAHIPQVKVNPHRARSFARAIGFLTKTDKTDAMMLAQMGAALQMEPGPPPDKTLTILRDLHVARAGLIKDRTAAKNRGKNLSLPLLRRQNKARLKQIDQQLEAVEKAISTEIKGDERLTRKLDILLSIPGISKITAFAIIIEMPELGTMTGAQAASLTGLAPRQSQSGKHERRAHIRGGRANLRHALYMPALVATRFNPDLKQQYDRHIKAGKPPKVAITAAMRKLITLANALVRDNREWTNNHACA